MQDDIRPAGGPTKIPARQPQRSMRLRGHSLDAARSRLTGESSAQEEIEKPITISADPEPAPKPPAGTGGPVKKVRFARWKRLNRNVRFGIIALALLVFGAAAVLFYNHEHPSGDPSLSITKHKKAAVATTVASPLSGVQVDPSLASRPVTGIMIENSDDARPQSGLQAAGAVFEAVAEGGVTRFLALFQDTTPQYIGPVRSLRPYYLDYASAFDASIVHVGGSPDALSEVQDGNFRNLDQFYNGAYFTRITARAAPHNVYTSFDELDKLNAAKGYTSSKYDSWPRKADKKLAVPTAKTIQFAISGPDYYDNYTYQPTTDSYLRSEGGAAHTDLTSASDTTGVQLQPKVVIAIVVPLSQGALDASGAYYSDYADTGTGNAYVFEDGGVTTGTWSKPDSASQIQFSDAAGNPIKLNAGQTWITLVSADNQVTYNP